MSFPRHLKADLVAQLIRHFKDELESLRKSADAAAEAATHSENKPENKYDTRGLEASYLAGAQRARSLEILAAIKLLETMAMPAFHEGDSIKATALVELDDGNQTLLYFLMTVGAGYPLTLNESAADALQGRPVTTISLQSPIGQALLEKCVGDRVSVRTAQGKKDFDIIAVL